MARFQHVLIGLALLLAGPSMAQETSPAPVPDAAPSATEEPSAPEDASEDDFSLGEVPTIETMELTPDIAKRALDAYVSVREKYKDAALENYDTLQDFVENNAQGRAFEADIKAAGFPDVEQWNLAITTLGFAYSNTLEDQSEDIKQQIEEIKADGELAQDMKDRMAKSLEAMIPSENNTKIVEELIKDQTYAEKLKSLDVESE